MRALQFTAYGGPEVLTWADAPVPHAGPGQVRITVRAASVNPIDWKRLAGAMSGGQPLAGPEYLGIDAAGVVVEVGEGGTGVSAGDDVFGRGQGTQAESAVLEAWAASRRPSTGRWPPRPAWPVRPVNAVFACSASRPGTRFSSTVARAAWERSPCRWRWPAGRG